MSPKRTFSLNWSLWLITWSWDALELSSKVPSDFDIQGSCAGSAQIFTDMRSISTEWNIQSFKLNNARQSMGDKVYGLPIEVQLVWNYWILLPILSALMVNWVHVSDPSNLIIDIIRLTAKSLCLDLQKKSKTGQTLTICSLNGLHHLHWFLHFIWSPVAHASSFTS